MSHYEALVEVMSDGTQRTLTAMAKAIKKLAGCEPTRGSLSVYLTKLRQEGFEFQVQRPGRRGGECVYALLNGRRQKSR
jgi:hypothetical protein